MLKRWRLITAAACASVAVGAFISPAAATASGSLPTMTVALQGAHGISVSGSTVSGAVEVVSTFSGHVPPGPNNGPAFGLIRLYPGASIQQAAGAVRSHHGDINALTPYGSLLVSQMAPSTLQTVLIPGDYVAINITGNGQPAIAQFTVSQSSSPAALPSASATESTIEFAFRGPRVLHDGTVVRAVNRGWLVHMNDLIRVPNRRAGNHVIALLRAGKDRQALRFLGRNPATVSLVGPSSPGALQQEVVNTKPGYYVEACFMNTGDGREHTQLGMVRLVRVVK